MAKHPELNITGICVHWRELAEFDGDKAIVEEAKERGMNIETKFLRVEPIDAQRVDYVYFCEECNEEEHVTVPVETDYIYLAECPNDEDPFKKYTSHKVACAMAMQLRNTWVIPKGAEIRIKREVGGGGYYTVVCYYNTMYPYAVEFAYFLEGNIPDNWSPAAKRYLEGGEQHV